MQARRRANIGPRVLTWAPILTYKLAIITKHQPSPLEALNATRA
jgi:hypothetical protein